jgi:hypothetical protein
VDDRSGWRTWCRGWLVGLLRPKVTCIQAVTS